MKAVENDFAKQTHGRLSVAQAKKKKKSPKVHVMSSGLILCLTPGGEQQSGGNARCRTEPGRAALWLELKWCACVFLLQM